ncbi:MAG: type 4a pilus biogenesis protein PilO, partial [Patescibacteria group bacterium]
MTSDKSTFTQYRRFYQVITPIVNRPYARPYTTVIFSILAVSLFGWYAIRPTVQTILFLRREIADKTVVNQKMEEKITALIEAQATYEEIQPRLPLVSEALPEIPEAIDIVTQLRNLAVTSGASISAIQTSSVPLLGTEATPSSKIATAQKQAEFPVVTVISGPYTVVKSFLDGLISMRRLVTIEGMEISPLKGEEGSNNLRLVLRLNTYYLSN